MDTLEVKDHSLPRLRDAFARRGLPPWRADQLADWVYRRGVEEPERMTNLPAELRARLGAELSLRSLERVSLETAADGTQKGVLRARDGALIEAVLIPEEERTTLCVSTQVGCPLACSFCATGALGFTRNLRAAEIVDQVSLMRAALPSERPLTNVVFMGMGEPLLNLPAVLEAVRLLVDPRAFGFAPRRVTVSTAGVVPKIPALLRAAPVNLAVSLHATTDAVRDELVPLNRRFPLRVLLGTLAELPEISRRRPVFFEYTLLEGVNDSEADAARLVSLLADIPSKVNVIPMNPHPDAPYRAPGPDAIGRFMAVLSRARLATTLRRSRGADIDAACGQLALRAARGVQPGPAAGAAPAPPATPPRQALRALRGR
jgi:23S rRNA (adenine2503-C2)-methyltransferase